MISSSNVGGRCTRCGGVGDQKIGAGTVVVQQKEDLSKDTKKGA